MGRFWKFKRDEVDSCVKADTELRQPTTTRRRQSRPYEKGILSGETRILGLKLRDEFLGAHMHGTAIALRTSDNQGAAQESQDCILSITYPTADVQTAMKAISTKNSGRPMSNNTILAALRNIGYGKDEMTGHGFHFETACIPRRIFARLRKPSRSSLASSKLLIYCRYCGTDRSVWSWLRTGSIIAVNSTQPAWERNKFVRTRLENGKNDGIYEGMERFDI
jgi:hypothetical protein